ncbi:unnamed protein product [Rangifer tarandus platyrhynchus]|uniref:Uncharacterized protein n=1 Tax=Rangifer tarandus platyrhynchus TaxID=3082113 RepID=A0AC59YW11_RANTA
MPSPELSLPWWGVGPGGGGWGPGLRARGELPNSGARSAGPRGEGVPWRDLGGGSPVSEWGRASPTPVRLPPAARPPSRSLLGSALLRPEFSIPWIPGSRGRGEEDQGKGASLRGEAAAAVAPPSPGQAASGDRLGIRVQLQPGGGEGPPLTQHAATLPWPREARACPAGLRARPVPGTPRLFVLGERAVSQALGEEVAALSLERGESLSAAVWPRRSSPPLLRHLLSAAPKLFAPAPSPQAVRQPSHPRP